jgi:TRAP-type C4-dicarboxylate transport system permease small subunit
MISTRSTRSLIKAIDRAAMSVAILMLILLVLIVSSNVLSRYLSAPSLRSFDELTQFISVWLIMMGSLSAACRREHIVMELFHSGRFGVYFRFVSFVLSILSLTLLFVSCWIFLGKTSNRLTVVLQWPRVFWYLPIAIAAAGIFLVSILELFSKLRTEQSA